MIDDMEGGYMNSKKYFYAFYIAIFVSTIVMTFSITYAYVRRTNNTKHEVSYRYVNLLTTYENGSKISLKNMNKGMEKRYSFSIDNSNIDSVIDYKLSLRVITPFSNVVDNNFVYKVESSTENPDKNNILVSKEEGFVPISNTDIGNGTITPNTTHNYVLTIKYNNTLDNVNFNNKVFVSDILVENVVKGN